MKKLAIIFFGVFSFLSRADEFIYPIASYNADSELRIYLLYQKTLSHIELWAWNPVTKKTDKALLSTFTPAGMKLLPDQSGFSFIDNGRIRIQFFDKRSPKSVSIYEPLSEITLLQWINRNSFYFSAKERDNFAIYQANMKGELHRIIGSNEYDCLYPQKVEDSLFYIKRMARGQESKKNLSNSYQLMKTVYPSVEYDNNNTFNNTENFERRVELLLLEDDNENKEPLVGTHDSMSVIDFNNTPVAFLKMISKKEGFVLAYDEKVFKQDATVSFVYYHLYENVEGQWEQKSLFQFSVPAHLLLPTSFSRLYESMLPLLPRHLDDTIFFVNCLGEQRGLDLFSYSLYSKDIQQLSSSTSVNQNFFAPIAVDNENIFFGGNLLSEDDQEEINQSETNNMNSKLNMSINESGVCLELPVVRTC